MKKSKQDQLVQTALWYYEEGLDQSEIGRRVGKSRSMVSRMLTEARDCGIVEVKVNIPLRRNTELESRLLGISSLRNVWVLDDSDLIGQQLDSMIVQLAIRAIQLQLHDEMKIGVAWSRTLFNVISAFPKFPLKKTTIVQLSGSIPGEDLRHDGTELVRTLAEKTSAAFRYLPAPLVVRNSAIRDSLMEESSIAETLRLASDVNIAIVGIGAIKSGGSGLRDSGFIDEDTIPTLLKSDIVGDMVGQLFTSTGRELNDEFNNRVVGIRLSELSRIPTVIAVAYGIAKSAAILGGLRGGWFNQLVTDAETAKDILSLSIKDGIS